MVNYAVRNAAVAPVRKLLELVDQAIERLPEGDAFRAQLEAAIEPFNHSAPVVCYNLEEMAQQAPDDVQISEEVAAHALRLLRDRFPHPWDEMPGFVREAMEAEEAQNRSDSDPSATRGRGLSPST